MITKLRRATVALTAVCSCLVLVSPPAGAVVVNTTADVTSGNMRLQNGTNTLDLALGGGAGTNCSNAIAFDFDVDSTGTTGTIAITGGWRKTRVIVNGVHYIVDETFISNPAIGSITGSSTTGAAISGLQERRRIEIYKAANGSSTATDCVVSTLICRFGNVNLTFSGTYNGDIHSIGASDTMSLASGASTTLIGLPCSPPFSTYTGGTATITSMSTHILTPP